MAQLAALHLGHFGSYLRDPFAVIPDRQFFTSQVLSLAQKATADTFRGGFFYLTVQMLHFPKSSGSAKLTTSNSTLGLLENYR